MLSHIMTLCCCSCRAYTYAVTYIHTSQPLDWVRLGRIYYFCNIGTMVSAGIAEVRIYYGLSFYLSMTCYYNASVYIRLLPTQFNLPQVDGKSCRNNEFCSKFPFGKAPVPPPTLTSTYILYRGYSDGISVIEHGQKSAYMYLYNMI